MTFNHLIGPSKSSRFKPCDISEIFESSEPDLYTSELGFAYQICDPFGNTIMGDASKKILDNKYEESTLLVSGEITAMYSLESLFYATMFPSGIKIQYKEHDALASIRYFGLSLLPKDASKIWDVFEYPSPVILVLRKDELQGEKIIRKRPRSWSF